jgi:hypothetical protein
MHRPSVTVDGQPFRASHGTLAGQRAPQFGAVGRTGKQCAVGTRGDIGDAGKGRTATESTQALTKNHQPWAVR